MHYDLSKDLFKRGGGRLFREDAEVWLALAAVLVPLLAALAWILLTPLKPPRYPRVFLESDGYAVLLAWPVVRTYARDIYPYQFEARSYSRILGMLVGAGVLVAFGRRRGDVLRQFLQREEVLALPIVPDRVRHFIVIDHVRRFALAGFACFLLLLVVSFSLTIHLERTSLRYGYQIHDRMAADIWGSSVYYVALRFGQVWFILTVVYASVLALASGLSKSPALILAPLMAVGGVYLDSALIVAGGAVLAAVCLLYKMAALFGEASSPKPQTRWVTLRIVRALRRGLARVMSG